MLPDSGPSAPGPRHAPLRLLPVWVNVQLGVIGPAIVHVPEMSAARAEQNPVDENAKARTNSLRIVIPCRACSRFSLTATENSSHVANRKCRSCFGSIMDIEGCCCASFTRAVDFP